MRAAQLHDLFGWGAFSEDAVDRDGLVPVARQRAAERGIAFGEVIVVGDTVSDVRCARAGGAKVIVVETGFSSPDALAAAGPDLQVADLAAGSAAVAAFLATCAEGGAGG